MKYLYLWFLLIVFILILITIVIFKLSHLLSDWVGDDGTSLICGVVAIVCIILAALDQFRKMNRK
jgi:small neutral amino acid transporter SnatA (MarC family)